MRQFITGPRAKAAVVEIGKWSQYKTAICGGLAMAMYGSDRLTRDIDVLTSEVPGVYVGGKRLSIGGCQADIKNVPVDFIVRDDEYQDLYEEALATAKPLKGSVLPVVLPEYLFVMKWEAHRTKDLLDLATLIRLRLVTEDKVIPLVRKFLGRGSAKPVSQFFLETAWRIKEGLEDE